MKLWKIWAPAAFSMALLSAPANAVIQLGFAIDESGSIGATDFVTIRDGLADAIGALIPTDGGYEISVVTFSSDARTVISARLIDSVAARDQVVADIKAAGYRGGGTLFAPALDALGAAFLSSNQAISATYINFATDGVNGDPSQTAAARAGLIDPNGPIGVDNISVEGIGGGVNVSYLTTAVCYPTPCDQTSPYNFPTQGFYIQVANAAEYAVAIQQKIQTVVNPTPEPGTLTLLGLSMLGLGLMRRKVAA